jgi:hypothetical protein
MIVPRRENLNNHLRSTKYGFEAVNVVSCMRTSVLCALKSFSYQCKFLSSFYVRAIIQKRRKAFAPLLRLNRQMEVLHLKFSFDTTCKVAPKKGKQELHTPIRMGHNMSKLCLLLLGSFLRPRSRSRQRKGLKISFPSALLQRG